MVRPVPLRRVPQGVGPQHLSAEFPDLFPGPVLPLDLRSHTYNSLCPGLSRMPFALQLASPPNICISGWLFLCSDFKVICDCFAAVSHCIPKLLWGNSPAPRSRSLTGRSWATTPFQQRWLIRRQRPLTECLACVHVFHAPSCFILPAMPGSRDYFLCFIH